MIRNYDLIGYLPPFLQKYYQFKEIFKSENPEIFKLHDEFENVKDRSFVEICDLDGLKRWEKMLNIRSEKNDSIKQRRIRILTKINDEIPYTMTAVKRKLDSIIGEGNYEISVKDFNFKVTVAVSEPNLIETLEDYFKGVLPANLILNVKFDMNRYAQGYVNFGNPFNVKEKYLDVKTGFEPNKNYNLSNDLEIITLVDTIKKRS